MQTDEYIYKITKNGLSDYSRSKLKDASQQGLNITVNMPRSSIESLWPRNPYKSQLESANKYSKTVKLLVNEAIMRGGNISLKGELVFSFSDSSILVQVNDAVCKTRKQTGPKKTEIE